MTQINCVKRIEKKFYMFKKHTHLLVTVSYMRFRPIYVLYEKNRRVLALLKLLHGKFRFAIKYPA